MGFFYCLFSLWLNFIYEEKNMKTLDELLKGKDEVWFELLKEEFENFIEFANKNKLKWSDGKNSFSKEDFKNHSHFAHISITKDRICSFVPMFMWTRKEYKHFIINKNILII